MGSMRTLFLLVATCLASGSAFAAQTSAPFAYLDMGAGIVIVRGEEHETLADTADVTSFCWGRDPKHLIVTREHSLERLSLDGSPDVLLSVAGTPRFPSVCEKNGQIVFAMKEEEDGQAWRIHRMQADGSQRTDLCSGYDPCFSPDGSRVYLEDFTQGARLYVLDLQTGEREQLIPGEARRHTIHVDFDGARVVFSEDGYLVEQHLFGGERKQLTAEGIYSRFASYSPDGGSLLYFREEQGKDALVLRDLHTDQETVVFEGRGVLAYFAPRVLEDVSPDELLQRSADNSEAMSLGELRGLDRRLKPYPWRQMEAEGERERVRSLYLHGLQSLTLQEASALARNQRARNFYLPDLLDLPVPVARVLFRDDATAELQLGISNCSPLLARHLGSLRATHIRLDNLETISSAVARELARIHGPFSLDGLRTLDVPCARELSAWNGNGEKFYLSLDGLTELTPDAAREFAACRGWGLSFGGVQSLSPELIEALAPYRGASLRFNGLRELSLATAQQIARQWSIKFLEVSAIEELDPAVEALLEEEQIFLWRW